MRSAWATTFHRRSKRGAHTDAVEPRSQRRVLARGPQRLYLPPIMDPIYGYPSINVEAQLRDPSSLLSWTKRMLAVRKTSQAFGRGTRRFLKPGNRKILAYFASTGRTASMCRESVAIGTTVELISLFKGRIPSRCSAAPRFRRSATCPTCSLCRPTASTGSN